MKINVKNQKIKIFIKAIIDTMIPESNDKLLPKASKAINLNRFVSVVLKNENLIKELKKFFLKHQKDKKVIFSKLGVKIAKSREIEIFLEEDLLKQYFSSKLVKNQLNKKMSKNLSKNKDNTSLLKLVKNSSVIYK